MWLKVFYSIAVHLARYIGIPPSVVLKVFKFWILLEWRFRHLTFSTRFGHALNRLPVNLEAWIARRFPLLSVLISRRPIEREVLTEDDEGNVEKWKIWIRKFSNKDVEDRTKIMSQPVSTEESRRGRSSRGRDSIHVERIRLFNFERGLVDWNFTYPAEYWDDDAKAMRPHPQAGQKVPINRHVYYHELDEATTDQIVNAIDALNEPPEELAEIRDEDGTVTQEEQHTPTEPSFAAR